MPFSQYLSVSGRLQPALRPVHRPARAAVSTDTFSHPIGYPWRMTRSQRFDRPRGIDLTTFAMAATLLTAAPATADTLKCGRHQITLGDSKGTVLQECGEPDLKEVLSGGEGATTARKEQWLYNRGERRFPALLTFEGMTLVRIDFLTRE
jgi:hypothetical protein